MAPRPFATLESAIAYGERMQLAFGIAGFTIHCVDDLLENRQECFIVAELSLAGTFCGYMR